MEQAKLPLDLHHTPGPWTVHEVGTDCLSTALDPDSNFWPYSILMPSPPFAWGRIGAAVVGYGDERGKALANAHLIAAAPDLLSALIAMRTILGGVVSHEQQSVWDLGTAAIAKAKGKTE